MLVALGAFVQINPIWLWGPYEPWRALSPAQPDWYVGWLDGALRHRARRWQLHLFGSHDSVAVLAGRVAAGAFCSSADLAWPWIEAAVRHDRAAHQLLEPRARRAGADGVRRSRSGVRARA